MSIGDASVCSDFALFMQLLSENRKLDDRIIHQLNTTIPTKSFSDGVDVGNKCKNLHMQVLELHEKRKEAIKTCIQRRSEKTDDLLKQKNQNPEDFKIRKQLNREVADLRLFQQELGIEEIVHKRATKAFYERCRGYYNMSSN